MKTNYKKVDSKLAHEKAHKYRLSIFQEWSGALDGITSFQFGLDTKKIKDNLLELIDDPVLYFAVQEDDEHYYINYLIYHPFDWADYKVPIIGKVLKINDYLNRLDSHRHDTESVLLQINKETGLINMVTVSHYSHIFGWDVKPEIIIESHSHAIRPKGDEKLCDDRMYRIYQPLSYRLENIFDWSDNKKDEIKNQLKLHGDISWLDEQFDGILKNTTATGRYRSQGLQHLPGDIMNDPDKLIKIGRKLGR